MRYFFDVLEGLRNGLQRQLFEPLWVALPIADRCHDPGFHDRAQRRWVDNLANSAKVDFVPSGVERAKSIRRAFRGRSTHEEMASGTAAASVRSHRGNANASGFRRGPISERRCTAKTP